MTRRSLPLSRTSLSLVLALVLAAAAVPAMGGAAPAETPNAAEIRLALAKLNVVGSVLYVAAHPDDENTAFLAWCAKGRLLETGYLSVTRGDGGQNLIGNEAGELMGVLRTQELLAARRLDGARQFFSRAIDFGYSKSAEETFAIWGHEQVLSDLVWVIRAFRPDVIVTRFPATGEGGHGNHTASAILAGEAFEAAADPAYFPEQLRWLEPWQPKRLLWNVFRFGSDAPRKEVPGQVTADLGAFNALLGRSYTEIAALSRSMHKSQGFGSAERRGSWLNDFKLVAGEPTTQDLFEGVDLSWARYGNTGKEIGKILRRVEEGFRPNDPAASVPLLVEAWTAIGRAAETAGDPANFPSKKTPVTTSNDGGWKREGPKQTDPLLSAKRAQVAEAIRACLGLWTEAIAAEPSTAPGGDLRVATMVLNRSAFPASVEKIEVTHAAAPLAGGPLAPNQPLRANAALTLPAGADVTQPYWLYERAGKGLYAVPDPRLVGRPENTPPLAAWFTVQVAGASIPFETPVVFRRTDPVKGEIYRPFVITPPVMAMFDEKVYAFGSAQPKKVRVTLTSGGAAAGILRLRTEAGFAASPAEAPFAFTARGEERTLFFTVTPPARAAAAAAATIAAEAVVNGKVFSRGVVRVDYPHIPQQTLFPPAEARVLRLDVKAPRAPVGYVMGSGDEVPDALRQMGYTVTLLSDDELENGDLSRYAAIVTGIRAYNTRPRLKLAESRLMSYVEGGGTVVAQYNTTGDLVTEQLGPHPFKLSRDRVTVEEAPVRFLNPVSPLLTFPNKLAPADFDGWVQERGLYFPGTWDPRYETVIESHDPGEGEKPGGLLYARVGKGAFVYTGYAFFRQLPAGVPGAYRLFVNLVSAGAGAPAR
ncbi:MAG: PIG-L family deacetylase [Thermoanaerobaculia bacterium]|nr:PIG-L family deacetylase [Thermoanaerobaculia bacterium]